MTSARRTVLATALLAALPAVAPAQGTSKPGTPPASSDIETLRQKLKADKRALVADNMKLTETEAKAFWPLYDEYQQGLAAVNQRLAKAIGAYADAFNKGSVPNDVARQLMNEAIGGEDDEVKLKRATMSKLEAAIGGMKAARYLQIENKIRAVVKFDLAAEIPLVY